MDSVTRIDNERLKEILNRANKIPSYFDDEKLTEIIKRQNRLLRKKDQDEDDDSES